MQAGDIVGAKGPARRCGGQSESKTIKAEQAETEDEIKSGEVE